MSFDDFSHRLHRAHHDARISDGLCRALARLRAAPLQAVLTSGDDDDPTTNGGWSVWADGGGNSGE